MPKVLLADDNEEMLETLERIFMFYNFEVEKAINGAEAVKAAETTHPDLILLDGMMPVMDGFEACKILKSNKKTKNIPIVFLTANYTDTKDRIAGFELGADDYLLKPFNSKELVARSKAILKRSEMMRLLKSENEKLNHKNKKIEQELESLFTRSQNIDKSSIIDELTGLYNYVFFKSRLNEEYTRAVRYNTSLSLVVVSVNNFNKITESLGFQVGSYVVMKIANYLVNKTRVSDILARSEDDRFCILLPHTDKQGAYFEAERIRTVLSNGEYIEDELIDSSQFSRRRITELQNVTVNLGVTTFSGDTVSISNEKDLINQARQALKASADSGKNKTVHYEKLNQ